MIEYRIKVSDESSCSMRRIQKSLDKVFGKNHLQVEIVHPESREILSDISMLDNSEKIQPEVNDIMEAIQRYLAVNDGVCVVASFTAFEFKCPDCSKSGEDEINVKDDASRVFAFGPLEGLRCTLNELRDMVEDKADEEGFVSM